MITVYCMKKDRSQDLSFNFFIFLFYISFLRRLTITYPPARIEIAASIIMLPTGELSPVFALVAATPSPVCAVEVPSAASAVGSVLVSPVVAPGVTVALNAAVWIV